MTRPRQITAKPLSLLLGDVFTDAFARQGFASRELVTRWADIAGADIAASCEPIKLQWRKPVEGQPAVAATLVLRVDGPMALEVQHMSDVIVQRVNRFFGWNAVGRITLRQAPLSRPAERRRIAPPDPAKVAREAESLSGIEDDALRQALARLGASIKRK